MSQHALNKLFLDNWPIRRRWLGLSLLWLAGNVQYLIVMGSDTALAASALTMLVGAFVSLLGVYVFGSVWDDNNKRQTMAAEGPIEDSTTITTVTTP